MLGIFTKISTIIAFAIAIPTIAIALLIGALIYHWSKDDIGAFQSVKMTIQDVNIGLGCTGSLFNFIGRSDDSVDLDRPIFQTPVGSQLICKLYADTSNPKVDYRVTVARNFYESLSEEHQMLVTNWLSDNSHHGSYEFFLKKIYADPG